MKKIRKAVIEVFGSCNYSCKMCPQSKELGGREKAFRRVMPIATFKKILDELKADHLVKEIYLEGSGEPTMNKRLPEFIEYGNKLGFLMSFITNGTNFTGPFMHEIIDSGMHYARISVIGSTRELYHEWMSQDNLEQIISNANETLAYIKSSGSKASLGSYHLITDNFLVKEQVAQYKINWIEKVPGIRANIWKMHNWAGSFRANEWRGENMMRSCGRPNSPDIVIRAGGINGEHAAVVPCCIVLGRDSEAVMGHLSNQTIKEVYEGEIYNELRRLHDEHRFDEISYCKDCDMLYDAPDALVWTSGDADYNTLTGGDIDMSIYRK